MKKANALVIILSSLLIGGLVTLAMLAQMGWRTYGPCSVDAATNKVDECVAVMEYGFPFRFISSNVNTDVQGTTNVTTKFDVGGALYNWGLWSFVSFVVIAIIARQRGTKLANQHSKKN